MISIDSFQIHQWSKNPTTWLHDRYTWPYLTKVVVSNTSSPWWASACKKSRISINSFQRHWWLNDPAFWLIESSLGNYYRTRFFPNMQLSKNHKEHCCPPFLGKKSHINGLNFHKSQKYLFWTNFWAFSLKMRNFWNRMSAI